LSSHLAAGHLPRDPGVQPERTLLSWRRTLLALSVVALLAARLAYYSRAPFVLGAVCMLWGVVVFFGWRRMRALLTPPTAPARTIAVTGFCAFLLALVAGALVLISL
jgi:Domain of unknown function (DUF202)